MGVTSFAAGPLSTVAGAETFLTEEDLGTLDTYSVDTRIAKRRYNRGLLTFW